MYLSKATAASTACTTHRSRIQYHTNTTIACVALSTLPLWQVCSCRKECVCVWAEKERELEMTAECDPYDVPSVSMNSDSNVIVARTGWTHMSACGPPFIGHSYWDPLGWTWSTHMYDGTAARKKEGLKERKRGKEIWKTLRNRKKKEKKKERNTKGKKKRKKDCIWCYYLEMWGAGAIPFTDCPQWAHHCTITHMHHKVYILHTLEVGGKQHWRNFPHGENMSAQTGL